MTDFYKEALELFTFSQAIRRDLHMHPELGFHEVRTSGIISRELRELGLEVTTGIAKTGVIAMIEGSKPGPVVMLRFDIDALPINEQTGAAYASKEAGLMHACGHDIHMSVWAGTIHTLVALKNEWKGTLLVIAQQAEEISGGAGLAIETGLFTKFPKPDYALAYHINPELESGKIGLVGGPVFAGVKTAEITVYGKGGHGAYPEKCIDPIVIAARIVLDLQTIVSREISPLEPVVVTVGSIHGGTRPNIIPDEVKMELTLRYYSDEVIEKVIAAIQRISRSAAEMAGMPEDKLPLVKIETGETPPLVNNQKLSDKIRSFASETIGEENIIRTTPAMVGEDFGKYGRTPENIPICLIWLGSTSAGLFDDLKTRGEAPFPLHSPFLNPDYEKTIETGIKVMAGNVIGLMGE